MTNKSEFTFVYPPALWPLSGWQGACHHLAPSLPGASSCQKFGVQDLLILPDISYIYIYIIYPRWTARIHCKPLVEDSPLSAMTHVEVEKLRVLRTLTGAFGGKWTCSSLKWVTAPQRFDVSSPVAIGGLPSANIDSTSTMLNASSTREVSKPNARNRWNSRSGTCCPWRSRSLIYFAQQQVTAKS